MEKKELIEKNIRLVKYIASKKMGRNVDISDLIQEGCIEFIKSIEKYDEKRGCKLSTFLFPRINKAINHAISNQSRTIRIPLRIQDNIVKALNIKSQLSIELNREPTIEEIAQAMKKSVKKVRDLFKYHRENSILSLDSYTNDGDVRLRHFDYLMNDYLNEFENYDDLCLEMFISSKNENPEEIVSDKLEKEYASLKVKQLFLSCNLTEYEIEILKLRYGFYGEPKTLNEVGKIYGVSKQSISQVELTALKKIRTSEFIKTVNCYGFKVTQLYKYIDKTKSKLKINVKKINVLKKYKIIKRKNIYDYFKEYSKEEIDLVLSNLDEENSYLLLLRYGGNLENPITNNMCTKEQIKQFNNKLIPEIQKQLVMNKKNK